MQRAVDGIKRACSNAGDGVMLPEWNEQMSANDEDLWTLARSEEDGRPLVLRFLSQVPASVSRQDYPHLIHIHWGYPVDDERGMPESDLHATMIEMEEALLPLEAEGLARNALIVTGNGRKEWFWYTRSVDEFIARLNDLLSGFSELPIALEASRDPEWSNLTGVLESLE